jgi:hypothetical protein
VPKSIIAEVTAPRQRESIQKTRGMSKVDV